MLFGLLHDYVAMGNIASMSTLLHKIHGAPRRRRSASYAILPLFRTATVYAYT